MFELSTVTIIGATVFWLFYFLRKQRAAFEYRIRVCDERAESRNIELMALQQRVHETHERIRDLEKPEAVYHPKLFLVTKS